ncbi:hypothetical protein CDD81_2448 [Ophiocordyceps australis]|uniref:Uncharacterized protein n=1 Tax=Ophiocordyceps australis TaxID=1399860 RepID=A0A2C5XZ03_9HYPO|nr:hypothetical protein CDD81_2448 [Ophiocordyceps australis]
MGSLGLILLVASCAAHAQLTYEKTVVAEYIKSLEANATIDWRNPPAFQEVWTPPHCMSSRIDAPARPVTAYKKLKKDGAHLRVNYDVIPHARYLNIHDTPVELHKEDSTWVTKGSAKSWNVGAGLLLGKLSLSSSYGGSIFESEMKIQANGAAETCPPGSECHFEDWIFHLNFWGLPRDAKLSSSRTDDICPRVRKETGCFAKWAKPVCFRLKRAFIDARIPIKDMGEKKILTTTVFSREYYGPRAVAVSAVEDCIFKLDDGRWYDSERDYYSPGEGWVARARDQHKPDIPDRVRLADCPASRDQVQGNKLGKRREEEYERKVQITYVSGFKGF